jgi:hypothetical protein
MNYELTVMMANFQNESRSHGQLKLLKPNFKSLKNFLKTARIIHQLHGYGETCPS